MTLSDEERDGAKSEKEISRLVNHVRENEDEASFIQLQSLLSYYISFFGKRYRIAGHCSEEIEQECLYALRYKAIEDFDPERGKFKSFAILCIRRHLFSIIKANRQQKRRALNDSLSLDENRSEDGDYLTLIGLVQQDQLSADEQIIKSESTDLRQNKLMSKLSKLEQEVFKLYIKGFHYDEIVDELLEIFPRKKCTKKTCDNALQRIRSKAQYLAKNMDFN